MNRNRKIANHNSEPITHKSDRPFHKTKVGLSSQINETARKPTDEGPTVRDLPETGPRPEGRKPNDGQMHQQQVYMRPCSS